MNYLNKYAITIILSLLTGSVISCRKLLDINPPVDQLTSDKVFTNDNSAISVLLSIYNQLSVLSTVESNISPTMGIYADELTTTNSTRFNYLNNAVLPTDGTIQTLWSGFYSAIYTSNSLIDAMQSAKLVSDSAKIAITGEAKFLRAFCYLYLVNLWERFR